MSTPPYPISLPGNVCTEFGASTIRWGWHSAGDDVLYVLYMSPLVRILVNAGRRPASLFRVVFPGPTVGVLVCCSSLQFAQAEFGRFGADSTATGLVIFVDFGSMFRINH